MSGPASPVAVGSALYMSAHRPYSGEPRRHGGQGYARSYEHPSRTASPRTEASPSVPTHDPVSADLRNQVIDRLRWMNTRHARHAWERRHSDPIGPHALAFFYTMPARGRPPRCTLYTATRLFLDGSEVASLPRLLYDLAGVARTYLARGDLDPRVQMADRQDDMPVAASYIGIGVSSLDTPDGAWEQVRQSAVSELDIAGRCFALLIDGTMIVLDRLSEKGFGAFHIASTHDLNVTPGLPTRAWRWDYRLPELSDPDTCDIWRWLDQLHQLIRQGHHGR